MSRKSQPLLDTGTRLVLDKEVSVPNTELKWGYAIGENDTLHDGKFIVEISTPSMIVLADADWKGETLILHSSKWKHVVEGQNIRKLIKVAEQLEPLKK